MTIVVFGLLMFYGSRKTTAMLDRQETTFLSSLSRNEQVMDPVSLEETGLKMYYVVNYYPEEGGKP